MYQKNLLQRRERKAQVWKGYFKPTQDNTGIGRQLTSIDLVVRGS